MNLYAKIIDSIVALMRKKTVIVLMLFIGIALVITIGPLLRLSNSLVETTAIQDAKLYADAISEFRSLYASEVIDKIDKDCIEVTHDYQTKHAAIPLPATLSIILGNEIGKNANGSTTKLYSAYPFPWRKDKGGLKDAFSKEAWEILSQMPDQPYYRFEQIDGHKVLRYAKADVMNAACVNCHNTHPQTPKNNWKEGDVRGILEISRPVQTVTDETRYELIFTILLYVLLILVSAIFVLHIIRRLNWISMDLENQFENVNRKDKEKEVLLKEIHHRVKNNLQVISSLLNLQAGTANAEEVTKEFEVARLRIGSMATIHELLYKTADFDKIDYQVYVHSLVENIRESMDRGTEERVSPEVIIEMKDIYLNINTSIPIGLIITEILTNAFKYAFVGREEGTIEVKMEQKDSVYELVIKDNGIGLPSDFDKRSEGTLGHQLILMLVEQLAGTLQVKSEGGTQYIISFYNVI